MDDATRSDAPLDLVTVYTGPMWRVLLLEGRLLAEGIPVLVPDRMIKTIDPFITGANAFDLRLQVPAENAKAATVIIAEGEATERAAPELDPAAKEVLEVERLGRRLCYAAMFGFTSPLTLWYAAPYLHRAAALELKPRGHVYALASIPLAILLMIGAMVMFPALLIVVWLSVAGIVRIAAPMSVRDPR
ncbi:MAG: hypothetical protein O3A20_10830 [Planctomycetota bacterium]|nr:hypothetical protein [Planctomycetota bacterium]